jgi:purine-binding chemotaxis protein CheW
VSQYAQIASSRIGYVSDFVAAPMRPGLQLARQRRDYVVVRTCSVEQPADHREAIRPRCAELGERRSELAVDKIASNVSVTPTVSPKTAAASECARWRRPSSSEEAAASGITIALHARSMAANNDIVVFAIGARTIGVPASTVREMLRAVAVTGLPGAPVGVEGVIDVRGTLIPVVDLSQRLGLVTRPIRASDQLLICDVAAGPLAVRVDRLIELRAMTTESVPPGAEADTIVQGLMRTTDGVIVICELSAFLAEVDIEALATAISRLGAVA